MVNRHGPSNDTGMAVEASTPTHVPFLVLRTTTPTVKEKTLSHYRDGDEKGEGSVEVGVSLKVRSTSHG